MLAKGPSPFPYSTALHLGKLHHVIRAASITVLACSRGRGLVQLSMAVLWVYFCKLDKTDPKETTQQMCL